MEKDGEGNGQRWMMSRSCTAETEGPLLCNSVQHERCELTVTLKLKQSQDKREGEME